LMLESTAPSGLHAGVSMHEGGDAFGFGSACGGGKRGIVWSH